MRHPRITYQNAFHHVMNRGINGKQIFESSESKKYFLDLISDKSKTLKIRILAYCVLNNHFHLIIQNCSGKMSEFLKRINSLYGYYYRKTEGGIGYVFQGRYKSTLIQEDEYLKMSLLYLFLNPVRAGIESNPYKYLWSSIQELYIKKRKEKITDHEFVEELFSDQENLVKSLNSWMSKELPIEKNRFGVFLGDNKFLPKSLKLYNRRSNKGNNLRKRIFDQYFKMPAQIISEFEEEKRVELDKVDFISRKGKQIRGELLLRLKDDGGLKYSEIITFPWFESLKYNSLGQLYKRTKEKQKRKFEKK